MKSNAFKDLSDERLLALNTLKAGENFAEPQNSFTFEAFCKSCSPKRTTTPPKELQIFVTHT